MPQFLTSEAAEDILAALDLVDIPIILLDPGLRIRFVKVIADLEKSAGR